MRQKQKTKAIEIINDLDYLLEKFLLDHREQKNLQLLRVEIECLKSALGSVETLTYLEQKKLILSSKNKCLRLEQKKLLAEKQRLEEQNKAIRRKMAYFDKIALENKLFSYQIDSFRRSTTPSIPIKKSRLFNW